MSDYAQYFLNRTQLTIIFIVFALLLSGSAEASTLPAGVPNQSIWFSKEPFFVGESITLYTLLYNSSEYRLNGTVILSDGTTTIGKKDFVMASGGASTVVSFPWLVTPGDHSFSAKVLSEGVIGMDGKLISGTLASAKTGEAKRFADTDTDHDVIGNILDTDDDNDGLSDVEEKKLGTDPVNADTDRDGITDKNDTEPLKKNLPTASSTPTTTSIEGKDPLRSIREGIEANAPESVAKTAIPLLGGLERFRVGNGERAEERVATIVAELKHEASGASSTATTSTVDVGTSSDGWSVFRTGISSAEVVRSPYGYTKLFFFLLYEFFSKNVYAFYLLIIFILFQIIRGIWGIFK